MKKYIIEGGHPLSGVIKISGAKNVVLKALVAACLTDEEVVLHNVPQISDVLYMIEMVRHLGGEVKEDGHTVRIRVRNIKDTRLSLETAAKMRASSLFFAPFLLRQKHAEVPNPGGDRIGARRIDMHIDGLEALGARVEYNRDDGYFYGVTEGLRGCDFAFSKNTHTGTEQMILAAVMAEGATTLSNVAQEPEVDELIALLNLMGGKIKRVGGRTIEIEGVERLHGAEYTIQSDRNEAVTFAIMSALTGGKIWLQNVNTNVLQEFISVFKRAGGEIEEGDRGIRFYLKSDALATSIETSIYPGFMTDWQGPWCILMTQAQGESIIHETIYEDRFQYVEELKKMGAEIELFNPPIKNPREFYNFNYDDCSEETRHAARIRGKSVLHDAVVTMHDLRAGATVVLASLIAKGTTTIYGVEQIERGYENFDSRLRSVGAVISCIDE